MTQPLCVTCRIGRCNRRYGRRIPKAGLRIIDGKSWNWHCSKGCAAKSMGAGTHGSARRRSGMTRRIQAEKKRIQRFAECCKPHMDEHGRIDAKVAVKLIIEQRRLGYDVGFQCGYRAGLRKAGQRLRKAA